MKKKLLCGILACMMSFSAAFPLVACKNINPDQGQTENNGENPNGQNPGGQNPGGETPGEEKPGEEKPGEEKPGEEKPGEEKPNQDQEKDPDEDESKELEPGTVITDEDTKTLLFNSLSETELGGLSYSASAELLLKGDGYDKTTKIVCEGFAVFRDGELSADLNAYTTNEGEGENAETYLLFFLRGSEAYYTTGVREGEEKIDFAALKEQLKAEEDPLVLEQEELPESLSKAASTPALIKMMKNLPALFDGVVTKTEGGYSLTYSVGDSLVSLMEGIESVLGMIDENHEITLGGLFSQPYLKDSLEKLLHGVTAKEFKEAAESFLPEDVASTLPEPAQKATAITYVETLMRSGTFYKALTKDMDGWEKWKTFSSVPLEGIISLIRGEDFVFGEEKLVDSFKDYAENMAEKAANYLFDLLSVETGKLSDEKLDVAFRFDFDNDKKLLGFSVDALIKGNRTLPPKSEENPGEEENPGGEENPENPNEGDENPEEGGQGGEDGGDENPEGGDGDGETEEPGDGNGDGDGGGTEPDGGGETEPGPDDGDMDNGDGGMDSGDDMDNGDDMGGGEDGDMDNDGGMDGDDMEDGNGGMDGDDMDNGGGNGDMGPGDSEEMPGPNDMDGDDGEGDPMPGPNDMDGDDMSGTSIRTMKRADGDESRKVNVRGSLKLETVSASSPELFDLTGCTFATEDDTETIKSEK